MNVLFVLPIFKQQLHSQVMDAEEIKQQITMRAASAKEAEAAPSSWWEKNGLPFGKLTVCYWTWPIYSWFTMI